MNLLKRLRFGKPAEQSKSDSQVVPPEQPAQTEPQIPSKLYEGYAKWELAWLTRNRCPDCHEAGFFEGPSGGMSTNYTCANPKCGSKFNIAIVGPNQIMGERISPPSPEAAKVSDSGDIPQIKQGEQQMKTAETSEATGVGGEFLRNLPNYFIPVGGVNPAFEPDDAIKEGEEAVGSITSPEIKALFERARNCGQEIAEAIVRIKFGRTEAERANALSQVKRLSVERNAISELMWAAVRLEVGGFDYNVGLRAGWQVVKTPDPESRLGAILAEVLGIPIG